jgi:hypothetical protein
MKYTIFLTCGMLFIVLLVVQAFKGTSGWRSNSDDSCMSERDLAESLAALTSPSSNPRAHREILLRSAGRSTKCRAQVVAALIKAMDKPNLKMERDSSAFFLWHYGGEVLGALQASEALDLLIANLSVTDGESPSMTHYPAVETVIRLGSISIPKLGDKLKHEQNARIRRLAVFCIASIGGTAAKQLLVKWFPQEKEKCVSGLIQFTLKSFANAQRPNQIASEDSAKFFSAFYCIEE